MQQMSYDRLLDWLVDLKALAVLPEPEERTLEISSYDRRSVYDGKAMSVFRRMAVGLVLYPVTGLLVPASSIAEHLWGKKPFSAWWRPT